MSIALKKLPGQQAAAVVMDETNQTCIAGTLWTLHISSG
jgi:hypothetical protein